MKSSWSDRSGSTSSHAARAGVVALGTMLAILPLSATALASSADEQAETPYGVVTEADTDQSGESLVTDMAQSGSSGSEETTSSMDTSDPSKQDTSTEAAQSDETVEESDPAVNPRDTPRSVTARALPRAAGDRAPIFSENFDGMSASAPIALTNYLSPKGYKYSAAPYWLDAGYCNGFLTNTAINVSDNDIDYKYCGRNPGWQRGDYEAVRVKAYALGLLRGVDPMKNFALSTNTSGGLPSGDITNPGSVMFRTDPMQPIAMPKNRFISFSVDAANTYCENVDHPKMQFQYLEDNKVLALPSLGNNGFIDPCTSPGSISKDLKNEAPFKNQSGIPNWVTGVSYGTFYSGAFLSGANGTNVGLILRNTQTASSQGKGIGNPPANTRGYVAGPANGNDGAIDNIEILDVSPTSTKSFDPVRVPVGQTSTMTITVNNTKDLAPKDGWQFVDTLPEGLKFANTTVTGTCINNTDTKVQVNKDAGTLTVSRGILTGGQASCTLVTTVTSALPQKFVNGEPNGNFSNLIGLDGPNDADVEFYQDPAKLTLIKKVVNPTDAQGKPVGTGYSTVGDWTLTAAGTTKSATGVTGASSVTNVEVPVGAYTLSEAAGISEGYEWTDLVCTNKTAKDSAANIAEVTKTGGVVSAASVKLNYFDDVTCTFTNAPKLGSVIWEKTDNSSPGKHLAGSEWTLTGPNVPVGTTVVDCIKDTCPTGAFKDQNPAPGVFEVKGLIWGNYTLVEAKSPAGYEIDKIEHKFTINHKLNYTFDEAFVNKQLDAPHLPLTGGQSAQTYVIAGLLMLGGAGGAAALVRRKRVSLGA